MRVGPVGLGRARVVLAAAGAGALLALLPAGGSGQSPPVSSYPTVKGGVWTRGPNLKDAHGHFQPRQEHAAVELNGFVYLIGGLVPLSVRPNENEPEPFPFQGTGQVQVYTPRGHPTAAKSQEGFRAGRASLAPIATTSTPSPTRVASGPWAATPACSAPRGPSTSSLPGTGARAGAAGAAYGSPMGAPASAHRSACGSRGPGPPALP